MASCVEAPAFALGSGGLLRTRLLSSSAHRRHHELVALAGAAVDLRTLAELEVAREADAHLAQPRARARHRDAGARQAGIGFDEGVLDLVRRHRERALQVEIVGRDLDSGARLTEGFEIAARRQAAAG